MIEPPKTVLHVGCGTPNPERLHPLFRRWNEIRVDIDPRVRPDIVADFTSMPAVADASVDGVWCMDSLEHVFAHQVPLGLAEFYRVLRSGGIVMIKVPDLEEVAARIVQGKIEQPALITAGGAITPLDMLYGHRRSIELGNTFMAHKTGFTSATLEEKLRAVGFDKIETQRDNCALYAWGNKP